MATKNHPYVLRAALFLFDTKYADLSTSAWFLVKETFKVFETRDPERLDAMWDMMLEHDELREWAKTKPNLKGYFDEEDSHPHRV